VAPYPGQSGSPPLGATLDQRARSYLHANCAFCHRPDGTWSGFDVRFDVPLKSTNICNAPPGAKGGDLGVPGALLLTPGQHLDSVIWLRMHALPGNAMNGATGRMPSLASYVVDTQATDLISQWIDQIPACPM
jgi:cellulase/cellobiase CelA1